MDMAIIETKNATYTYPGGSRPSISDVSVRIEKGEFALITGPSGCGKTVTALSILQLLRCPPAEIQGRILFRAKTFWSYRRHKNENFSNNLFLMEPVDKTRMDTVFGKT
jgi:ABC-type glutathione transport system ATPase component